MDDAPRAKRRGLPVLALLPLVVFGALAALFLLQLTSGRDTSLVPSALIGKPAPEFTLQPVPELLGENGPVPGLSKADLLGKVSVVNVFASWCVPCRQEHPILTGLAKDKRVQLVGINYKDKAENARRFLGSLGNPYARIGADEAGRATIDWGVYGVPETFIVGRDGTIRFKFVGPLSQETFDRVFAPEIEKALVGGEAR
ncbi:DsbE family thiol:disulfide interchange protein [Stappia sp. F7233]|uniref:DsbE family thiol:disulfide interchange protein n=2 Tax=Stappia albiluteola TaxID=2758565 RepID=A0A839AFK3_9HYPH|nr:DsbE family thiol:disulfide interchange protein [Stappia albiluteola]